MADGFVKIHSYLSPAEAHLAKLCLGSYGIDAQLENEMMGALWIYSNAVGGVKLLVKPADANHADSILGPNSSLKKGIDPLRVSAFRGHNDTLQRDNPLFQRAVKFDKGSTEEDLFASQRETESVADSPDFQSSGVEESGLDEECRTPYVLSRMRPIIMNRIIWIIIGLTVLCLF